MTILKRLIYYFELPYILYNHNEFSIAWGIWEQNHERLCMRWNGTGNDMGYPKVFGYPQWMLIDPPLYLPFLQSLTGMNVLTGDEFKDICKIIDKLRFQKGTQNMRH